MTNINSVLGGGGAASPLSPLSRRGSSRRAVTSPPLCLSADFDRAEVGQPKAEGRERSPHSCHQQTLQIGSLSTGRTKRGALHELPTPPPSPPPPFPPVTYSKRVSRGINPSHPPCPALCCTFPFCPYFPHDTPLCHFIIFNLSMCGISDILFKGEEKCEDWV